MATITSRTFRSALGVEWLVHHVEPQAFSPTLARLQANARHVHGGERRQPWLVFVGPDGSKRRLTPVPADWTTCSAAELELMCMRAVLVPPAPARRDVDHETASRREPEGEARGAAKDEPARPYRRGHRPDGESR